MSEPLPPIEEYRKDVRMFGALLCADSATFAGASYCIGLLKRGARAVVRWPIMALQLSLQIHALSDCFHGISVLYMANQMQYDSVQHFRLWPLVAVLTGPRSADAPADRCARSLRTSQFLELQSKRRNGFPLSSEDKPGLVSQPITG